MLSYISEAVVSEMTSASTNIPVKTEISSTNEPTGHVNKKARNSMGNSDAWFQNQRLQHKVYCSSIT